MKLSLGFARGERTTLRIYLAKHVAVGQQYYTLSEIYTQILIYTYTWTKTRQRGMSDEGMSFHSGRKRTRNAFVARLRRGYRQATRRLLYTQHRG